MNHVLTLMQKIRESSGNRNSENLNKENTSSTLVRSSSVVKVEKNPKATLMRGSASTSRLASYKFIK